MCLKKEELINFVNKSPLYLYNNKGNERKTKWLSLFIESSSIQDPVGGPIYSGIQSISHFYDNFIDLNNIEFYSIKDYVNLKLMTVIRDVIIKITTIDKNIFNQNAYVLYIIVNNNGKLSIKNIRAYWKEEKNILLEKIKKKEEKEIVDIFIKFINKNDLN